MTEQGSASYQDAILQKVGDEILSPERIKKLMYEYLDEFDGVQPKQIRNILIQKRNEDLRNAIADRDETGRTITDILQDFDISYGMYWQIVKNNPANVSKNRQCKEEGCEYPVYSHGLCTNHYQKHWRDHKGSYIQKFRRRKVFVELVQKIQKGNLRIGEALTVLYGIDAKTLRAITKITENLSWETVRPKLSEAAIAQIEQRLGKRQVDKFIKNQTSGEKGRVQGIVEARQKKARREFLDFLRTHDTSEFAAVGEKYGIEIELLNDLAASEPEKLDWGLVCFFLSKEQAALIEESFSRTPLLPQPLLPAAPSKIQSLLQRMEAMNI